MHTNDHRTRGSNRARMLAPFATPLLLFAASASAQPWSVNWYTVDDGGATFSTGGTYSVGGTIGQPDANSCTNAQYFVAGGFWSVVLSNCYANCDTSTIAPILNVNDFVCCTNRFASGSPYANCDNSTLAPILNVNDYICFNNRFAVGCP